MSAPDPSRSSSLGSICTVIPAAGSGTRLGGGVPKILLAIDGDGDGARTVWDILHERLAPLVDHVHLVLAPSVQATFPALPPRVTTSTQDAPRGMGDAIFGAAAHWRAFDAILVVWGDQAGVSPDTLARTLAAHRSGTGARLTLPLTALPAPYVQYDVDAARLVRVRESREGDACDPGGDSDVGVFCLATDGLADAWSEYAATAPRGRMTGERNFLPFLPFLSTAKRWPFASVRAGSPDEARGINTPDDLAYFRARFRAKSD